MRKECCIEAQREFSPEDTPQLKCACGNEWVSRYVKGAGYVWMELFPQRKTVCPNGCMCTECQKKHVRAATVREMAQALVRLNKGCQPVKALVELERGPIDPEHAEDVLWRLLGGKS